MELPKNLEKFINEQEWVFAKTYAKTWPHEYILEENVDNELFLQFADHIDRYGYENYFYQRKHIYFSHNGYTYWHMGNIINRCLDHDTYHCRKIEGRLPKNKGR